MSAITAKANRKMKKYAVLTREPRCFLGSFDFSWEQRKVSDLAEKTYGGGTPTTSNEAYWNGDIPWIQSSDVVDGKLLGVEPRKWITQDGLNNSAAQLIPGNSIAIITRVGVGKLAFMPYSYATSQDFLSLSKLNAEPLFTVYACYKKLQSELNAVQGTSIKGITKDELLAKNIMVPRYAEQQQIGAFFKQLDNLITLHQRKCVFLFGFFQAFISMIFTASTFSWEQRKLSEITDKVTEKNAGLQYVETFTNSAEFGIISQRDFFDHDIAKLGSLDGYYIVKNEDFVYNPRISTSAPVGPINRNKLGRTGVMSPLYTVFRPHDIDTTYLEYFFKCGYWHSFMNFNGDSGARSDRFSIRDNVFFQMPIPIPDIDEQRKIGELLTCLDNLITLHQRECISFTARAGRRILTANKKRNTSSWEQRKLGELGTITTGNTPSTSIPDYYSDDGIVWVTPTDICENITFESARKLSDLGQQVGRVVPKNTILVTCIASIGKNTMLGNTGSFNQQINGLTPNENKYDPYFLLTESALWSAKMKGSAAAGTMQIVNRTEFSELKTWLPSLIEQQAIGAFFKQLDHLITLHQRKPFLMKWRTSDANRNKTNRLVL